MLIDDGGSCNIIYSNLFEKMELNKEKCFSYEGSDLKAPNSYSFLAGVSIIASEDGPLQQCWTRWSPQPTLS